MTGLFINKKSSLHLHERNKNPIMSNRVVHFEIPCNNPEKTMDFFKDVFGWNFQQFGNEPYWLAITGDDQTPGINGGIMKKRDPNQPIANSINVTDIDKFITKVESSGGKIVVPKMPIPSVGWLAYFTDPDGNIHGLHQQDPNAM
jgi:predicted enzyme related to lactoylglutathione lyase